MVAATAQLQPANGTRWLNYLVLSLLLNALFISLINMPPVSSPVATPERLTLKLKSRAAPPPSAPATQVARPVTNEPAPVQKNIVTETEAAKKLAVPVTRPVPEKVATPVERKQTETEVIKTVPKEPARVDKQPELRAETPVVPARQSIPVATPAPVQHMDNNIGRQESTADDSGRDTATAVHEARYRKQVPPVYPRRALELGQQGTVTLHARVKPDGLPQELKIETTSGHSLLDKAALAAVEKWEFEPVIQDGVAITGWVRVPIEFVIQ